MISLIFLASLTLTNAGLVSHDSGEDHHKATSYQSFKLEHFHAVPTYVKKEHAHLLKHPLPAGASSAKLEVHHGGKHDHGYAIAHIDDDAHGLGVHGSFGAENQGEHAEFNYGGESGQQHSAYSGHEDAQQLQHLQGHAGYQFQGAGGYDGASLGHYQLAGGESHELGNHQSYDTPSDNSGLGHFRSIDLNGHGQN